MRVLEANDKSSKRKPLCFERPSVTDKRLGPTRGQPIIVVWAGPKPHTRCVQLASGTAMREPSL